MTLIRKTNPTGLFPTFHHLFDNFLGKDFFDMPHTATHVPAINVKETHTVFDVEVAAPGMEKDDFKIELNHNLLKILAKKEYKNEEKEKYTRQEFGYQTFERTFTLPEAIVADNIQAKYENGILKINIPKTEETKVNKRNIEII